MGRPKKYKYKMADLEKMTGVGRETIRFYLNSGLLPPPTKTSRNMAWYSDTHVELIKNVRSLQRDQFLPLKAIKSILHGHTPYEFTKSQAKIIASLKDMLLTSTGSGADEQARPMPPAIPDFHLAQLRELGWVSGSDEEMTTVDHEIIELWGELLKTGVSHRLPEFEPKHIRYVLETVDFMMEKQLEFFNEHMAHLEAAELEQVIRDGHQTIIHLFSLLHIRRLNTLATHLNQDSDLSTRPPQSKKKAAQRFQTPTGSRKSST